MDDWDDYQDTYDGKTLQEAGVNPYAPQSWIDATEKAQRITEENIKAEAAEEKTLIESLKQYTDSIFKPGYMKITYKQASGVLLFVVLILSVLLICKKRKK